MTQSKTEAVKESLASGIIVAGGIMTIIMMLITLAAIIHIVTASPSAIAVLLLLGVFALFSALLVALMEALR